MIEAAVEVIEGEPDPAVDAALERGLDATVPPGTAPYRPDGLCIVARRDGRIVGGVAGRIVWGWYEIRMVWIEASLRDRGLGRRLLSRAEDEARARGARYARLDTMSFQAPGFYRKCGYAQWGELPDQPAGHTRHCLVKPLAGDVADAYRHLPRVPLELTTARLRLRQFREADLDDLARLNADPGFARFVGGTRSRSDSWRQLAMLIGHWRMRGYGWYAVSLRGEDRVVGRIGHWYPLGWPEVEVGWALDPALWGRGLAVEGARACLDVARETLGLRSVISLIDRSNRASQRVAEKLGGRPERPFDLDGAWVDLWRTPTG